MCLKMSLVIRFARRQVAMHMPMMIGANRARRPKGLEKESKNTIGVEIPIMIIGRFIFFMS